MSKDEFPKDSELREYLKRKVHTNLGVILSLTAVVTISAFTCGRVSAQKNLSEGMSKASHIGEQKQISTGASELNNLTKLRMQAQNITKVSTPVLGTIEFEGTLNVSPGEITLFRVDNMEIVQPRTKIQDCKIVDFGYAKLYITDSQHRLTEGQEYIAFYEEGSPYIRMFYQNIMDSEDFGVIMIPENFVGITYLDRLYEHSSKNI